jgi:hypothetical protein
MPAPAGGLVADAHVGRELLAAPEDEHDAIRLEKRRLLGLPGDPPAERFVERLRPLVVGDAEGEEADALPHG